MQNHFPVIKLAKTSFKLKKKIVFIYFGHAASHVRS